MHYIRFVKFPQIEEDRSKGYFQVSALVTVETDLGEAFFKEDIALHASFRADTAERPLLANQKVSWKKGMRLVKVQMGFQLQQSGNAGPKAGVLCVSAAERRADDLRSEVFPNGILSIWSPPLPFDGKVDKTHVERKLFLADSHVLSIWEETGESIARHIWDGGLAFASYAALNHSKSAVAAAILPSFQQLLNRRGEQQQQSQLRVLELGAGVGVAGLALATVLGRNGKPHNIIMTDLEAAQDISTRNLEASGSDTVRYRILDWDDPPPQWAIAEPLDVVIFADCIYNTASIPSLVSTLVGIAQRWPEVLVVFAYKVRHDSENMFFDLIGREGFETQDHILFGGAVDMYTLRLTKKGLK